jgi:hypothetical protein
MRASTSGERLTMSPTAALSCVRLPLDRVLQPRRPVRPLAHLPQSRRHAVCDGRWFDASCRNRANQGVEVRDVWRSPVGRLRCARDLEAETA